MKPPKTKPQSSIPAPLWRRLAAILYDSFLVVALLFIVGFINLGVQMMIYGEAELRQMTRQGLTLDGPVFYIALLFTVFTFFTYCWTKKGQTLGMQAWKIKIINNNGQLITFKQSLLRLVAAIPSLFLVCAGVTWMKVDPDKKSWQDRASGSITVLDPH